MRRPNRNIEIFSMAVLDLFASALGAFIMIAVILFPNYMKKEAVIQKLDDTRQLLQEAESRADREEAKARALETEKRQIDMAASQCKAEEAQLQQDMARLQQEEARLQQNLTRAQQAATQLQQNRAQQDKLAQQTNDLRQKLAGCEMALGNTFLVVAVEWSKAGRTDVDLHVTDPQGHEFYWAKNNRSRGDFPTVEAQLSYDNTSGPGVELWQDPSARRGVYRVEYDMYRGDSPVEVRGNVFFRSGRKELPRIDLSPSAKRRVVANIVVGENGNVDVRIQP